MAKKKNETTVLVTRAEKKDATKTLIKELLAVKGYKHNELIDEVSALYTQRFGGEETDNINDVKGRVGSVLDIMKKESEVGYDNGTYMLKARAIIAPPAETEEEKPVKKPARSRKKKEETQAEEVKTEEIKEEKKPVKKTAKKTKAEPLPPAPIQPIAPVAPITPETAPEPIPEDKPAPKKRGRKPKATEEKAEEKPVETPVEAVKEEPKAEVAPVVEPTPEPAPVAKAEVMDISFLLGDRKPVKAEKQEKTDEPKEAKTETENKPQPKAEEKPVQKTAEKKPEPKIERKPAREENRSSSNAKRRPAEKPMTADERLCEAFLKRMRTLGGDYFEYYSVYLLERYSMRNGRRLEGLKISGGDHDGGIDGEIELTDSLGFKETIYIQSKNWNPEKGDEKLWVVGETLLQQFIGACACRQAKDGKQHCRGIFITTSRFTPEAKRILEDMSDKIVGYDGADLYEAAKECEFGLIKRGGEWVLDEKLLSGTKAFFHMM
ncbi:MAG: restriction endonuclease [Clostridia bacterium]|nr:restriction endonuclease [Clostridia bacterium]